MSNLFRFGIFQKLLITLLLVALVPLSVIWYVNYQNTSQQISNNVKQQLSDISDKLTAQVDGWVTINLKAMKQNAALADTVSMNTKRQAPILRSVLNEYKWTYLIHTIGPAGLNVGRSDDKEPIDYSDRTYFTRVMAGEPQGAQVVISKTTNRPALIMSVPITTADTTPPTIVGVFGLAAHLTDISQITTKIRIGQTGYAFLLNEEGKVIAHQKQEYVEKMADFSKHPTFLGRLPGGKTSLIYEEDGKKIIAYVQTTQLGWTMVAQQDYDEAYIPLTVANKRALVLLGITVLVVTLVAYFFSQRLAQPIRSLTQIADEMSRGRAVARVAGTERGDEIGNLARAIDRMGTSIRLALEKLGKRA